MSHTRTFVATSVTQTQQIAKMIAKHLQPKDVLALRGAMGAGKTAFVRGLAIGLGVEGEVASPTFSLVHEYEGNPPLVHFDLYRITSVDDLYTTGLFDYLDSEAILAIEWSQKVQDVLPKHTIVVTLTPQGQDQRKIEISGGSAYFIEQMMREDCPT